MVNPISSASSVHAASGLQAAQAKPAAQQKSNPPQDTVQLSAAAKAVLGDADHDGDSH